MLLLRNFAQSRRADNYPFLILTPRLKCGSKNRIFMLVVLVASFSVTANCEDVVATVVVNTTVVIVSCYYCCSIGCCSAMRCF